jgi:voltage-gated potassium channel
MIQKKLINIVIAMLSIIMIGVAGYMIIEKWQFIDAFYMTIITLTTVGFMEVQPLSPTGRIYTVFIIVVGFSVIIYGLGVITAFFVEGELLGILRRKSMEKQISKLNNHYIICGYGDMGKHVVGEFMKTQNSIVVIEKDENEINLLSEKFQDVPYINGDASLDAVLIRAGIERAKGLITTFASDKNNLFVVLTARSLNGNLRIVARSMEEDAEHKLKTAGANSVVSASSIGGMRIASEMLRPNVVSFLDDMLRSKNNVFRVGEAAVEKGSKVEGLSIKDSNIFRDIGLVIIAVRDSIKGEYVYNPKSETELKTDDVIVVMGMIEQINKLKTYTQA